MSEALTVERMEVIYEAARKLCAARERRAEDARFPSLNERDAYYILVGVLAAPMFEGAVA